MSLPKIVSNDEWLEARKALLADEKKMTKARDRLSTKRRKLPMVKVETDYVFEGPEGKRSLLDLFDGRRQLIVQHFMFDPSWEDGCPSCTAAADEMSEGLQAHLHVRDTTPEIDPMERHSLVGRRGDVWRREEGLHEGVQLLLRIEGSAQVHLVPLVGV